MSTITSLRHPAAPRQRRLLHGLLLLLLPAFALHVYEWFSIEPVILILTLGGFALVPRMLRALLVAAALTTVGAELAVIATYGPLAATSQLSTLQTYAGWAWVLVLVGVYALSMSKARVGQGPVWLKGERPPQVPALTQHLMAVSLIAVLFALDAYISDPDVEVTYLPHVALVLPLLSGGAFLSGRRFRVLALCVGVSTGYSMWTYGFEFLWLDAVVLSIVAWLVLRLARQRDLYGAVDADVLDRSLPDFSGLRAGYQRHRSAALIALLTTAVAYGLTYDLEHRLADTQLRAENLRFVRERAAPDSPKPFGELSLARSSLRGLDLSCPIANAANCANFDSADLEGALLMEAALKNADLGKANMRGAILFGAKLQGSNLKQVDLRDAHLTAADFSGADLSAADLTGATVHATNFAGADLRGTTLVARALNRAFLRDICFDKNTQWPRGFKPRMPPKCR